ncbi:MAG: hypothetical protein ABSG64_13090 [Solirubrobacteraceae bacterium]
MPRPRLLTALCMTAVFVAGCGSSNQTPSFVARATAVCVKANAAVEHLGQPTNLAGAKSELRVLIVTEQAELTGLKALTPPSAQRAAYAVVLRTLPEMRQGTKELLADVSAGDYSAYKHELQDEPSRVAEPLPKAWQALGLPLCGTLYG